MTNSLHPMTGTLEAPNTATASTIAQQFAPGQLKTHLETLLASSCAALATDYAENAYDAVTLLDSIVRPSERVIRRVPPNAQRILAIARDETADVEQLVMLVAFDPAVIRGLLRLANSSIYARPGSNPCVSIADAVRRVGAGGVESVVLRCMVEAMFCQPGGAHAPVADVVWSHMVRTAGIGRALGTAFSANLDEAFLLSMMHDVGKLIVFDRIGALRTAQRREIVLPPEFLWATLRVVHEALGGLAALEWGLGEVAASAIASHHRTQVFAASDRESQVTYLAECVDIARTKGRPLALGQWAANGSLIVGPEAIEAALAKAARADGG
ncbi:MAG: HDOD domain-containing protein [Gemmatimonadaceae bacterium]